jgi:hypothetical protein
MKNTSSARERKHKCADATKTRPFPPAEYNAARTFLESLERKKGINRKWSSYTLKHLAEKIAGRYVSNEALIQAAKDLGFRTFSLGGPNIWINIRERSVREKCIAAGWRP